MIKLATAVGPTWLRSLDLIDNISPSKEGNKKYPEPTRVLVLSSGQKVYIADTLENMRILLGPDYQPEPQPEPIAKKSRKKKADANSDS